MKKVNKKLLALLMSATLVTAGAGAFVAFNGVDEGTSITVSAAEITTDRTETAALDGGVGSTGDYADAGLYRIWMNKEDKTCNWSNKCANESTYSYLLDYITINGKTIKEYRDEYAALIASGEPSPITWETKMQPNIANDVSTGTATYAPIFVNVTSHGAANMGDAIDMYIPTSFINPADVTEIGIKAGFELEGFGFSKDVTWTRTSWGFRKQFQRNIISTTVTGIEDFDASGSDSFLSFYVSESDYAGLNTSLYPALVGGDAKYLDTFNFYDYIEIDGKSFRELTVDNAQGEQFFNVWGRANSFSTRWPSSIKDSIDAVKAVKEVTIKKGCQFPSYTDPTGTAYEVSEDVTFVRMPDGLFVNKANLIKAGDVTISQATDAGEQNELYQIDITCDKWSFSGDAYDYNYFGEKFQAMRKNIFINGVSLFTINTTVDDSAYAYSTSPFTNSALEPIGKVYQLFQNPTMLYGAANGNTLRVWIHKQYIADTNANEIVVKVANGYKNHDQLSIVTEDITATVWKKPINVTIDGVAQEGLVYGDKVVKPEDPTKEVAGYTCTFDNWYVAGTDTVYDFEANLEADVAIESRFNQVAIEYTITFVDKRGNAIAEPITFTVDTIGDVVFPEVPVQDAGWEAVWNKTPADLTLEDTQVTLIVFMTEYTITFMADGEVVGTATYMVEDKDNIVEPAVPEKEGYTGAWEAYELTTGDITVNAVYTEIPVEPEPPVSEEPEVPGDSEEPVVPGESEEPEVPGVSEKPEEDKKDKKKGCGSSLGLGVAGALTAVGAALVIKKRKED